jgi:hypothetical protein
LWRIKNTGDVFLFLCCRKVFQKVFYKIVGVMMYTGSCLCGALGYELRGELGPIVFCHCSRCRKAQGSAFAANSPVNAVEFHWLNGSETLREYESSPGKHRVFCSRCGSPIYSRFTGKPGILRLRVGTLDSVINQRPVAHIYANSHAEWYEIQDGLVQYESGVPG